MKKLLPLAFGLLVLASCAKKEDAAPTAPTIVGTWTGVSGILVITNKITGVVSTQYGMAVPSAVTRTYNADGTYTLTVDKSASGTGPNYVSTGTYTYAGGTITYTSSGTSTSSRVDVLTANQLIEVTTSEDSSTRFVGTDTWKR